MSTAEKLEDSPEVAAMLAAARTLSVTDFESAKAHLLREGPDGSCAYDQLVEVVSKALAGSGADGDLRAAARAAQAASYVGRRAAPALAADQAAAAAEKKWASASVGLATSAAAEAAVQNLSSLSDLIEWAGVGVSREDAFRLYAQMKSAASSMDGIQGMRFWGKISATESDYYVIEAEQLAVAAATPEFEGSLGPNKFTYLVSSRIGGEWTTLPSVTPAQIVAAGKVRRGFTGRLDAVVGGHPVFPESEAVYLRARIALITAATSISPGACSVSMR